LIHDSIGKTSLKDVKTMKDIERRLVSELMKNCRRSDRQLAKVLGVSQPTISRALNKLEKEGIIKEYTMIPDFRKLGYTLLAVTFVKLKRYLSQDEIEKARESARVSIESNLNFIMLERGMGMGYDGVFLSFHEDYTSFTEHMKWLIQFDFLKISETQSFLIDLEDEIHYRSLTFSTLAKHILTLQTKQKKEGEMVLLPHEVVKEDVT
jgi:DNA-binding Lrp family transcriptional regulator